MTKELQKKVSEYLNFWVTNNYGYMARCLSKQFGPPAKTAPAESRKVFENKILEDFKLKVVKYILPTAADKDEFEWVMVNWQA